MPGQGETASPTRPIVYCLVPRDLAPGLHELLRRHFRGDPGVEVVVERRDGERRVAADRRVSGDREVAVERRLIRSVTGRRVGQRRALQLEVSPAPLPRRARGCEERLSFIERIEPATQDREDVDTARLVTRIQAGERDLFETLYLRYFNRVYSSLRLALRDSHEAEDGAQQVFVNLLAALPRYELRGEPFRAWLFRIVRNQMLTQLRRRRRGEVIDDDEVALQLEVRAAPDSAEERVLSWISDPELLLFVERLPLAQRQVLLLRFWLDFTHAQIAEILDRSPSDVRTLQSRAQSYLRQRLLALEGRPVQRYTRPVKRRRQQARVLRSRRWALSRHW
jgi:RNA polymerase sigma-70 factor (ECF subfamily)